MIHKLLIVGGAAALVFALVADVLALSHPGWGAAQLGLAVAAASATWMGLWLSEPGRRWITRDLPTPRLAPLGSIGLAAWFGLVTDLFEVVHQFARQRLMGEVILQPAEIVWMAPLSLVVLFVPIGAACAAIALVLRETATAPVTVFVCVLAAAWTQTVLHSWLGESAAFLVALGLASQVARLSISRDLVGLARRTWPWACGLVIAAAAAVPLWRSVSEHRSLAALPPPPAKATNVLLVVLDTVRADHLQTYGYTRPTAPEIDRLAQRGIVFEWPIATSPWTLPTHATLFTGAYHHEFSADWRSPLDQSLPTLAEVLRDRGYATGGFIGNIARCERGWGVARGFTHYEDFHVEPAVIAYSTGIAETLAPFSPLLRWHKWLRNDAARVTDGFLNWFDANRDRPFFAFLNYFDAHGIYDPPPPWNEKFDPDGKVLRALPDPPKSPAQIRTFVNAYDACISYIDHHLARLIEHLRTAGVLDDTLIVVTADHGEQFGEHGLLNHANSLYRPLLHVPLIVVPPGGLTASRRIGDVVSLRDLAATVLDLAGVERHPVPGYSLAPLWRSDATGSGSPSPALAEVHQIPAARWSHISPDNDPVHRSPINFGDMTSVFGGGMQLIVNGDGSEELYRLSDDPATERNLIDDPAHAAAARELRELRQRALGR